MEKTGGVSPQSAPADNVTPAAAQPAASSSTVQQDFNSRVKEVKTPADIRRLTQEMVANSPKPGSQPKPAPAAPVAEAPAVETPPAEQPAAEAPESEEPAPAEGGESQEAPPTDQPSAEDEDEGIEADGPVTPIKSKRPRVTLPENDEVGRLAISFQKRNRDWDLQTCLEAARKQLGVQSPAAAPATTPEAPATPALPDTPEAVQVAIGQKLTAYKKAMAEVRFEDAADIQAEILQLQDHRATLGRRAEQKQAEAAAKYDADFDASNAKAVDLYPFAADPASPGYKRMMQLDAQFKRDEDPLYHSPNKPLKLAQMVAAELSIAPRNKNAAPAKPAAAPAAGAQPKKGVVPSGSSRTTPPAQNTPAVDPAIAGIKTMADLRAQLKRIGART